MNCALCRTWFNSTDILLSFNWTWFTSKAICLAQEYSIENSWITHALYIRLARLEKKLFCTFFKYLFSSLMSLIGLFWKVISLEFPRYLTHAHIHNVYTEPISFRAAVKLLSYAFIKSSLFLILLFLSWSFEKCGIIFNETELRMR